MNFINNKWVIYNFLPYEYEHLEEYLEKMASRGWILDDMMGAYLKFKKGEPKNLKYSVDIMDSVSFFDGKDSNKAVEYREYCKEAGWNFVCEREKIQVYCSEYNKDKVEIHTDETEKFNTIRKASLKYVCLNFITLICLLFTQYILTVGSNNAHFLASLLSLGSLLFVSIFAIHEILGIIGFIVLSIKGKRSLNEDKKVSYKFKVSISIKRIIYKVLTPIILLVLLELIIKSNSNIVAMAKLVIGIVLPVLLTNYIMRFIKNKNYKNNKIIISAVYLILVLLMVFILNNMIFRNITIKDYNHKDDAILTLKDFDDKNRNEDLYINREKSPIASYMFYSNEGEKVYLSYSLFESKYEWPVKYNFNKKINFVNKIGVEYIEVETNLPNDIKGYMNEHGHEYIIISPNKMIEISTIDNLSEDELINIVYKKLFK